MVIKERKLKRCFDIVISLMCLCVLSPLFLVIIVALFIQGFINKSYHENIFIKQIRISKGRKFIIYKFTICSNNISTPVGSILKKIYFDELPQLYNILIGDMSIVGPRPHIIPQYEEEIKNGVVGAKYIKGGMVGLIQAMKGNERFRETFARMASGHASDDKTTELIDRVYLRKYLRASAINMFFYDIWIILRCVIVVFQAKGI